MKKKILSVIVIIGIMFSVVLTGREVVKAGKCLHIDCFYAYQDERVDHYGTSNPCYEIRHYRVATCKVCGHPEKTLIGTSPYNHDVTEKYIRSDSKYHYFTKYCTICSRNMGSYTIPNTGDNSPYSLPDLIDK